MTIDSSSRTPPADPDSIYLSYNYEEHWARLNDLEIWQVSADVRPEGGEVVSHVGDIEIVLIDPDETRDAFGVLDGESGDLGVIGGAILDLATGGLDPELDERLEPSGNRILILNRAQLAEEWQGFGIGVLLAGVAIKRLSAGCRAAVCYPAPIGPEASGHDDKQQPMAVASLSEVWGQLGFEHFRAGVHVLDLALVTFDEHLAQLHKRHRDTWEPDLD